MKITTSQGRELSRTEFNLQLKAYLKGWDITDEQRQECIDTAFQLLTEDSVTAKRVGLNFFAAAAKQNLSIAFAHQEDLRKAEAIEARRQESKLTREGVDALHTALEHLAGDKLQDDESEIIDVDQLPPTSIADLSSTDDDDADIDIWEEEQGDW